MDLLIALGRVAVALIFVYSGYGKFADLAGTTAMIADKALPMPQVLAIASGALELVGGLLIIVGWKTRWAALALCAFTGASAYIFHDFWHLPEGPEQMNQMIHAMKNLSIMGGFLILAGAGAGRYSLDGRDTRPGA